MRIPLSVRFRSLVARDEYSFWWSEITDEEKALARMNAWELSQVIHECTAGDKDHYKRIFAEHLLNKRIAIIQAKPAYWAIGFGLLGVVGGAYLSAEFQRNLPSGDAGREGCRRATVQQHTENPGQSSIVSVLPSAQRANRAQEASQSNPNDNKSHAAAKP